MTNGTTGPWFLGFGQVRHSRLRPIENRFNYRCFYVQGEVGDLNGTAAGNVLFGINKAALISMHESDHGDGRPVREWIGDLLVSANLPKPARIEFRGFPRVVGYTFKPVSFWFCLDSQRRRYAIVVEVNNTFGERHCYLLSNDGEALSNGQPMQASKVFHVSPFCHVNGDYHFRFLDQATRNVVRIDHTTAQGNLLQTSMSGTLVGASPVQTIRALVLYPLFTVGVISKIHWQALRLWLKRVPFVPKPAAPTRFVSNGTLTHTRSIKNQ